MFNMPYIKEELEKIQVRHSNNIRKEGHIFFNCRLYPPPPPSSNTHIHVAASPSFFCLFPQVYIYQLEVMLILICKQGGYEGRQQMLYNDRKGPSFRYLFLFLFRGLFAFFDALKGPPQKIVRNRKESLTVHRKEQRGGHAALGFAGGLMGRSFASARSAGRIIFKTDKKKH